MKKNILLFLLISFPYLSNAQCSIWSVGNAQTVNNNSLSVSLFQNTRYGISKSLEIGAQPLAMVLLPNLYLKKQWTDKNNLLIASRHGAYYPGILMKFLQTKGQIFPGLMNMDRAIIFPVTNSPQGNLTFTNELLLSTFLQERTSCSVANLLLTAKMGLHISMVSDQQVLDTIAFPVLYARTQAYHKEAMWYVGAQLDGHFFLPNLDFSTDLQLLGIGGLSNWSIEHKALLLLTRFKNIRLLGGYKYAYTTINSSGSRSSFLAMLDFTYLFQFKNKARGGDLKGSRKR